MIGNIINLVRSSKHSLNGYTYLPLKMPPLEKYLTRFQERLLKRRYRMVIVKDVCLVFKSKSEQEDKLFLSSYEESN